VSRHYSKLPPVHGFTRVPDFGDGTRALRCNLCGYLIPSLGVGYHNQNGGKRCAERAAAGGRLPGDVDNRKIYARKGVYIPPQPPPTSPPPVKVAAPEPAAVATILAAIPRSSDQHAVFAYMDDGTRRRITDWTDYREALARWGEIDALRIVADARWYAVRSADDPDWNSADYQPA
jgi:hypothetical protein